MLSKLQVFSTLSVFSGILFAQTQNPLVRFHTNLGDIDVRLAYDVAPNTVINFLNYVNAGSYNGTFIHRAPPSFVVQGGGYKLVNKVPVPISTFPPIKNEYNLSNVRGTIAMAKEDGRPDSATSQWFFNTVDNLDLNRQNGGFTAFGTVANQESLAVLDKIAALKLAQTVNFDYLPVVNYTSGDLQDSNYVTISSIEQLSTIPRPAIRTTDGAISASDWGAAKGAAPGSYVEIYGSSLSASTRSWAGSDFNGNLAPESLDGVAVTVNGQLSYINYVSPTQVNIQIRDTFPVAGTYDVVVSYRGLQSAAFPLAVSPTRPSLLAPTLLKVGGKQFAMPTHIDGSPVVGNGIPGLAASPARPGETITFYGFGFGTVNNTQRIAGARNTSTARFEGTTEFNVGDLRADVPYAGLAVGLVGVAQFNVIVPPNAPTGDLQLKIFFNGARLEQDLYIPVLR